jgi:essential nuclear protein 1
MPTLPTGMQQAILPLMRPEKWTPHAIHQATRVFTAANSSTAQFFLSDILLDRVREDIYENKKLNVHLYAALKKSLYKPAAFFKGILFPLLQTSCTLREATIVSSVLARVSVPALHSAAALSRCCDIAAEQMAGDVNAAAPTNLCIKTLLDKNYALPFQTIDALVFHFLRFRPTAKVDRTVSFGSLDDVSERLPVVWHQCLLSFAQRYKNDIAEEQREALLDLLLVRNHDEISPEIRRELLAGRARAASGHRNAVDGDDTLMNGGDS